MRILITGGAGYVGTVLVPMLLDLGHHVVIYDTFRWGIDPVLFLAHNGHAEIIKGDVRDSKALDIQVGRADAVIHLAALVGFPICQKNPVEAEQVILSSTRRLVEAMLGTGKLLLNASTGSVYGKVEDACDEDTKLNPQSLYGLLKAGAEKCVAEYGGVSFRFATLFGVSPCMRFDLLPNAFVWRAVNKGHLVLYRGADRRTFLEVHDAARVYCLALEKYDQMRCKVYNVGDESMNVTKRELAQAVAGIYPYKIIEEEVGDDPDFRDYNVAYAKIKALGFGPRVTMTEALTQVGRVASICDTPNMPWRFELC